jgi:hypothetical protein
MSIRSTGDVMLRPSDDILLPPRPERHDEAERRALERAVLEFVAELVAFAIVGRTLPEATRLLHLGRAMFEAERESTDAQ